MNILHRSRGGGGTRSQTDGYVRPEIGGPKKDPYSDSRGPKIRPLQGPMRYIGYPYTDFHMYILNVINSKRAPQVEIFLPDAYS